METLLVSCLVKRGVFEDGGRTSRGRSAWNTSACEGRQKFSDGQLAIQGCKGWTGQFHSRYQEFRTSWLRGISSKNNEYLDSKQ